MTSKKLKSRNGWAILDVRGFPILHTVEANRADTEENFFNGTVDAGLRIARIRVEVVAILAPKVR